MRKTKIISTVGPSTENPLIIDRMLSAGTDVIRFNLSHGEHKWHASMIKKVRRIAKKKGRPVAVMVDLQGPRIRTGRLKDSKPVNLKRGQNIVITTEEVLGDDSLIFTPYKNLPKDVRKGSRILLDNGTIELKVIKTSSGSVHLRIVSGGVLGENKGINLPGINISAPTFTEKDRKDLAAALDWGVDYVAVSFVRRGEDINLIRDFIKRRGCNIPVIAKIEREEGVINIDKILDASDGVMVARGDLGVEMGPQKVPLLQKSIIRKADEKGKIVITATQILESMMENPAPTRAEVSDVANAILDGTDAVMLSGETARGKFPVEAVRIMDTVAREVEGEITYTAWSPYHRKIAPSWAVAHSACNAAHEISAKAIIVYTISGRTALMVSKFKPVVPIIVLTPDMDTYNRIALVRGASPIIIPFGVSTDRMLSVGEKALIESRLLKKGDTVVVIAGTTDMRGATNMMKIDRIGDYRKKKE
ncbi:MAG: pyruvate kinase [Deltaproteobacteria bacterium GWC2_42_11]|nr:MAG: pyruvate kinase [Deltaproteobacteria bacterium GWC2_42_11]